MGFLSDLVGTFTGSSARKASKKQIEEAEKAQGLVKKGVEEARGDLFKLFPASQENAQRGYQGALDVLGQTMPQQANVFQQGNVAAQNQLLAGAPQYQNAILGGPVDYSQMQATQLQQPDFSFANQQLDYTDPYAQPPPMTSEQIQNATANQPLQFPGADGRFSGGQSGGQAGENMFNFKSSLLRFR